MLKNRAISNIVAVSLLLAIMFIVLSILYIYVWRNVSTVSIVQHSTSSPLVITGVHFTVDAIIIDVRAETSPAYVRYVYIFAYPSRALIDVIKLNPPIRVPLGKTVSIPVNIGSILGKISSKYVLVAVGSEYGSLIAVYGKPIPIKQIQTYLSKSTEFVLLAARTGSGLQVDPTQIHFVIINPALDTYQFYYISGSTVESVSGKLTLWYSNKLYLNDTSFSYRYNTLGPVVVFVDPYKATQTYTVTIVDIGGTPHTFTLPKLVNNPSEVIADYLICWEDLWWPGTTAALDNYIDEVIRVTIFVNGTVRIEPIHGSGAFLHMFMLGSLTEKQVLDAVNAYASLNSCLKGTEYNFIVFVKPHGTEYSASVSAQLWDPNTCTYITVPPLPVFYRLAG
ncbi:MAG: hypothetical protein GXO10_07280 [Crenarchaeota archaeon]|nr:hypothetical protein [Thermoproteota archaeon]